jgi:hypothetical protein
MGALNLSSRLENGHGFGFIIHTDDSYGTPVATNKDLAVIALICVNNIRAS